MKAYFRYGIVIITLLFLTPGVRLFGGWNAQTLPVASDIRSVHFVTYSSTGYAAGVGGVIVNTTDGGANWTQQSSGMANDINDIFFINSTNGYAVADNGAIVATTNGGTNWYRQTPQTISNINSVHFANSMYGVLVADNGAINRTSNGGLTWSAISNQNSNNLNSVFMADQNNGYAVGAGGLILKTTDAGQTWASQTSGTTNILQSVFFSDATNGYAVGNAGTILKTTNGGANWITVNGGTTEDFLSVFITTNTNRGYIAGTSGTILVTSNSGSTWTAQTSGTTENLLSANFTSQNIGYAAGSSGTMLKTTDGGGSFAAFITVNQPSNGLDWLAGTSENISWNSNGVASVKIEYSTNGGTNYTQIAIVPATDLTYSWTVPNSPTSQAKVRISDNSNAGLFGLSGGLFSITSSSPNVLSPNGGEKWQVGNEYNITWTGLPRSTLRLDYSTDSGNSWLNIAGAVDGSTGSYSWTVPNTPSGNCMARLPDINDSNTAAESDNIFAIVRLELTAPSAGESLVSGRKYDIRWGASGINQVQLQSSTNQGAAWNPITGSISASLRLYRWTVPSLTHQDYYIRIVDAADVNISSQTSVSVSPPSVTVISPNGGEYMQIGTARNIEWTSNDVNFISIYYSTDNGVSWIPIVAGLDAALQQYTWTVAGDPSSQSLIKIEGTNNTSASDQSDDNFTITNAGLTITTLNGGERIYPGSTHPIRWTATGVANIDIQYSTDNGNSWTGIALNVDASLGVHNWANVPQTPGDECLLRIKDSNIGQIFDNSDGVFTIIGIILTAPLGGESWLVGSAQQITWESTEVSMVNIYISFDNGAAWELLTSDYPASAGFYSYNVPDNPTTTLLVRIMDSRNSSLFGLSPGTITITGLLLTSPVGGEEWMIGTTQNITWQSVGSGNLKIEYSTDSGTSWITIMSNTSSAPGAYSWEIPNTPGNKCIARLTELVQDGFIAASPDNFTITGEGIFVVSPNGGEVWSINSTHDIEWVSVNVVNVDVLYSMDNGNNWIALARGLAAGTGSYSWALPGNSSAEALVKVIDSDNSAVGDESNTTFRIKNANYPVPVSWRVAERTGNNAIIIVPDAIDPLVGNVKIAQPDAIGVFYERNGQYYCGGYSTWVTGANMGITIWANNALTPDKDGFGLNEGFFFKIWDASEGKEYIATPEYQSGPDYYYHNNISILSSLSTHKDLRINLSGSSWSMISSNIQPLDLSLENMMSGIVDNLGYMKNDVGEVYIPDESINTISAWEMIKGYQIYMEADDTLLISGIPVDIGEMELFFEYLKWNIISYLPQTPMPVADAFAAIHTILTMVKNSDGEIYYPSYSINQIGQMNPGEGYKLALRAGTAFKYPSAAPAAPQAYTPSPIPQADPPPLKYNCPKKKTGNSATIIVESPDFRNGDEIGVFDSDGKLIGSGMFASGRSVLTVWGDNRATAQTIEGAMDNERLLLRHWSPIYESETSPKIISIADVLSGRKIEDGLKYRQDGIYLVHAESDVAGSVRGADDSGLLVDISPNPASEQINIEFYIEKSAFVNLGLYTLDGRKIIEFQKGFMESGNHQIDYQLSTIPSGLYLVRLAAGGVTVINNIIIYK